MTRLIPPTTSHPALAPRSASSAHRCSRWLPLLFSVVAAVLTACRPSPTDLPTDAVAQVGDRFITTAEFSEELRRRGASARTENEAQQRRREILESLIDEESLAQRARAAGLDQSFDVQRRIRRLLAQVWREQALGETHPKPPSEDELRLWYDSHRAEFTEPPQARGMLIALRVPPRAADDARDLARARLTEARTQLDAAPHPEQAFADLARTLSDDPSTRRQGGDTGWIRAGRLTRWPEEVTSTLLSLPEPGAISPVLETSAGFFLVRLTDRKPARLRPFEEVRPRIEHRVAALLKDQREQQCLADARSSVRTRTNPTALAAVPLPSACVTLSQNPPSVPGPETHQAIQP